MAQTFTVSKERSTPGTRKHRTPVVVSAQPKTPITVSPPVATKATATATGAVKTTKVVKPAEGKIKKTDKTAIEVTPQPQKDLNLVAAPPDVQVRRRGRPRKVAAASGVSPAGTPAESAVARASSAKNAGAKLKRTRQHRVTGARLLDAERVSGKVPLAARRIVEQLQALLARASVEAFRGKKDRPSVTLSKLEEQAIQEALVLFQLKVSLQRGVEPRQLRVS